MMTSTHTVASANKAYFAGEFDWVGSTDGGATPDGDALAEWFSIIEKNPVAAGDAFWSLFGHDVPNCNVSLVCHRSLSAFAINVAARTRKEKQFLTRFSRSL